MKFLYDRMRFEKPYESDALKNREEFGKSLKNFINSVEDGCVLALDAKWGEGKTTFVKWWQKDLEENGNGYKTIYFDAFKHDFNSEPFYAIVKELYNQIGDPKDISGDVKGALKKLSEVIIPNLMAFGVMATATAYFGKVDDTTGVIAATGAKAINDSIKTFLSKKKTKTLKQIVLEFRETLEIITSKLFIEGNKKLIFIVDELDRCRPTFAAETIEKIKHLFSVAEIIWVLVMNRKQLEESIKNIYGTGEVDRYLNKFINVTTELPKSLEIIHYGSSSDHYNAITSDLLNDCDFKAETKRPLGEYVSFFARVNNLSIRAVQKVIYNLQLLIDPNVDNYLTWYLFVCSIISVLKVDSNENYKKIRDKDISIDILQKEMRMLSIAEQEKRPIRWLKYYLQFILCKNNEELNELHKKGVSEEKQNGNEKREFSTFCENNRDFCSISNNRHVEDIFNKIDIIKFERS